ncbi:MAG: ATP-binding cassette domain-containing protein, partial [Nitrospinae bacterium]|nr:ATP-binding cassette domain-containing protein [Nitrospinota bacterium]
MMMRIENVFKMYDKIPAISDVSINIEKGERVVILGPSGCGKTTLLRMIAGFIVPDKGSISIDGQIVAKDGKSLVEPEDRKIGMVFQDIVLWPHMSIYGNLEFGLKAKKIPKNERKRRIEEILEKLQMAQYKNSFPNNLSGGQQQRVALARALVMQPKI